MSASDAEKELYYNKMRKLDAELSKEREKIRKLESQLENQAETLKVQSEEIRELSNETKVFSKLNAALTEKLLNVSCNIAEPNEVIQKGLYQFVK